MQPDSANALTTLGLIQTTLDRDWDAAEKSLRRALEIEPDSASAHLRYGALLFKTQRFSEAQTELERARQLAPLSLSINMNLGVAHSFAGDFTAAESHFKSTLEIEPKFVPVYWYLARLYWQKGSFKESFAQYQTALTLIGDEPLANRIRQKADSLPPGEVVCFWLEEWKRGLPENDIGSHDLAVAASHSGDRAETLSWLEKTIVEKHPWSSMIAAEPEFDFLRGESNFLNAPGLTGKRENAAIGGMSSGIWRAAVNHTGGIGTAQSFFGTIETTRVEYANLSDVQTLSPEMQSVVKDSLRSFVMLPDGNRFRPNFTVSRFDLAAALVRGGRVPQYLAQSALFADVNDLTTRVAIESVQKSPNGKLFYDASNGGAFYPDNVATRIIAAVALVKAANLQTAAQTAILSPNISDYSQIPSAWRGYVAVALQKNFLSLNQNTFAPNRPLTRLELAQAMVKLSNLAIQ